MLVERSHLLQPLTELMSKKVRYKWIFVKQTAFNEIKRIVNDDTLLIYSYFNKRFDIHTVASEFELGAVISRYGKPTTLYSRKLTKR